MQIFQSASCAHLPLRRGVEGDGHRGGGVCGAVAVGVPRPADRRVGDVALLWGQ